ncbi:MFS transporter [Paenibacillus montaniterrae]|uniref:MFS transporter n=1 Tax=Paenibacillus montaniterrae TaxID=429341 RepID=A0A919YQV8_9BACL|nr:MFS transporter [Paenibacillus montaniterrae]GIP19022.1 MFS transporter [Paenibacillus montaniterrae]
MKKILWLACLSYLVIGIAHIIGGSILEQIVTHYEISYAQGGQWIMNQFFGFLVGVLLGPLLSTKLGKRLTVVLAFGSLTVAEAVYSLLPPWELMLVVAPFAGFGFGMIESVVGALIIDLYKDKKAAAMSRIETFFGLGALFIPLIAAVLIRYHIWEWSFPILTAISGVTLLLWLSLSFGKQIDNIISQPSKQENVQAPKLAKYERRAIPFLTLSMIFFFLYVGVEMSVSHYLPSIMIERSGLSESSAASMLSLFWVFMVIGRFVCGMLADRFGYIKYLLVSMLIAVLAFVGMVLLQEAWALYVMIALSGLGFSGVFGIGLVYVNACIQGLTDRTTSLLVACGGIGGALLPKLTGWLMDHYAVGVTVNYVAALVAVMLGFMIAMIFVGGNRNLQERGH